MGKSVKVSAPWVKFYREIDSLFKNDPDVNVVFDEDNNNIKIYVASDAKAQAIEQLIPSTKEFGNVKIGITVIPANKLTASKAELFQAAFEGNPAISYIKTIDSIFSNRITYVVFKKEVVQFFNDNLSDVHGLESTLYQTIADDVFGGDEGVFFCTDI